ncbi:hypothetical protein [Methylotuvimicrobium sp. KM1]|uniref:hypothetical protein n=1 Tax=Methylotuvimicrobium sp. KM1 TaxID=3377707 RepID=UPI003850678F
MMMERESNPEIIRKVFQEAQGHNSGGAFVCLPENIAAEMVEDTDRPLSMRRPALPRPTEASIDYAVRLIHEY